MSANEQVATLVLLYTNCEIKAVSNQTKFDLNLSKAVSRTKQYFNKFI